MEMRFVTNPRRVDPQGNPVQVFSEARFAVLVDGLSMSTSEIFAAGMQSLGRARIFGTPTPGQALPSALVRLPNGDVLQHRHCRLHHPGRDPDRGDGGDPRRRGPPDPGAPPPGGGSGAGIPPSAGSGGQAPPP